MLELPRQVLTSVDLGLVVTIKGTQDVGGRDLRRLLVRLDPDERRAWQEYNTLRQRLIMFFEPHYEAPELAEEVLDRIAKKSESYEITNVAEFAFGVARNLRKEVRQRTSALVHLANEEHLPANCGTPEADFVQSSDVSHKHECFLYCLEQLSPDDRHLIQEYYPPNDKDLEDRRRKLADSIGISWGTLRTRVVRLRSRLAECCVKCYMQGDPKTRHTRNT